MVAMLSFSENLTRLGLDFSFCFFIALRKEDLRPVLSICGWITVRRIKSRDCLQLKSNGNILIECFKLLGLAQYSCMDQGLNQKPMVTNVHYDSEFRVIGFDENPRIRFHKVYHNAIRKNLNSPLVYDHLK